MKSISLRVLKENLSRYTEQAARGEPIQVTRYNKPFVYLMPALGQSQRVGTRAGQHEFRPVSKRATRGRFLEVLNEDRNDE